MPYTGASDDLASTHYETPEDVALRRLQAAIAEAETLRACFDLLRVAGGSRRSPLWKASGRLWGQKDPQTALPEPFFSFQLQTLIDTSLVIRQGDAADYERCTERAPRITHAAPFGKSPKWSKARLASRLAVIVTPLTGPAPSFWISNRPAKTATAPVIPPSGAHQAMPAMSPTLGSGLSMHANSPIATNSTSKNETLVASQGLIRLLLSAPFMAAPAA